MAIIGQLWSIIVDEEVRLNLRKKFLYLFYWILFDVLARYMNVEVGAPQAME